MNVITRSLLIKYHPLEFVLNYILKPLFQWVLKNLNCKLSDHARANKNYSVFINHICLELFCDIFSFNIQIIGKFSISFD